MPRLRRILVTPISRRHGSENRLSLAEIMAQKEGTVNSQRRVRDSREFLEKSRQARLVRRQSGRPSLRPLIAAKVASILAHFSRTDIGAEMGPKIGYSYPRLGPRKREPLIRNDRCAISGRPRGNRGQATANPGGPLSGP